MAKGQQRSNREAKKPKAVKPKEPVVSSIGANQIKTKMGQTGGKK